MQTIYPYQVRFAIDALTVIADDLEHLDQPEWHVFASAAACLEHLINGKCPDDLEIVANRLRELNPPNPGARRSGKTVFMAVSMAIVIIEGVRHGLLSIDRSITPELWIGLDMGRGDRTVFIDKRGGRHHA